MAEPKKKAGRAFETSTVVTSLANFSFAKEGNLDLPSINLQVGLLAYSSSPLLFSFALAMSDVLQPTKARAERVLKVRMMKVRNLKLPGSALPLGKCGGIMSGYQAS